MELSFHRHASRIQGVVAKVSGTLWSESYKEEMRALICAHPGGGYPMIDLFNRTSFVFQLVPGINYGEERDRNGARLRYRF